MHHCHPSCLLHHRRVSLQIHICLFFFIPEWVFVSYYSTFLFLPPSFHQPSDHYPPPHALFRLHCSFLDLLFPAVFLPVFMIVFHVAPPLIICSFPNLLPIPNPSHLEERTPVVAYGKSSPFKENSRILRNEKPHWKTQRH